MVFDKNDAVTHYGEIDKEILKTIVNEIYIQIEARPKAKIGYWTYIILVFVSILIAFGALSMVLDIINYFR